MEQAFGLEAHVRESLSQDLIRYETFDELGLTHTCCFFDESNWLQRRFRKRCQVEVREEREVEHLQLDELEELIEEFEAAYERLGQPLSEFMDGYWKIRMAKVLDRSRPVTEEDIQRIKELGVVIDDSVYANISRAGSST